MALGSGRGNDSAQQRKAEVNQTSAKLEKTRATTALNRERDRRLNRTGKILANPIRRGRAKLSAILGVRPIS